MCRLMLANRKGVDYINKQYGLEFLLEDLELSMGGDGNGIALRRGRKITTEKGVFLSVKKAAEKLLSAKYEWCLFHTRLVSTATKQDKHCHPFRYKDNVLAHNGTDSSLAALGDMLGITDTEAALRVAVDYGTFPQVLAGFSGVFTGFTAKGLPFVAKGSYYSDLEYCEQDGAIIFCSELPRKIPARKVKAPFFWYGGKPVPEKSLEKRKEKVASYYDTAYWDVGSIPRFPTYFEELKKRRGK